MKTMLALLFSLYRHYLSFWFGKIRVIKAVKIMYENGRDADESQISKAGTDLLPHIVSSAPASEGSVPEISHCSKKQFLFYLSFYFISFNTFHNGSTLFPLSPSLSHDDPSPDIHPHKVSVYLHHNGMPTGSLRLPLPALKKAFAYPPHPARPIH